LQQAIAIHSLPNAWGGKFHRPKSLHPHPTAQSAVSLQEILFSRCIGRLALPDTAKQTGFSIRSNLRVFAMAVEVV